MYCLEQSDSEETIPNSPSNTFEIEGPQDREVDKQLYVDHANPDNSQLANDNFNENKTELLARLYGTFNDDRTFEEVKAALINADYNETAAVGLLTSLDNVNSVQSYIEDDKPLEQKRSLQRLLDIFPETREDVLIKSLEKSKWDIDAAAVIITDSLQPHIDDARGSQAETDDDELGATLISEEESSITDLDEYEDTDLLMEDEDVVDDDLNDRADEEVVVFCQNSDKKFDRDFGQVC